MPTDFDVQEWTARHSAAFKAEVLEVAGSAMAHIDLSIQTGKGARVLVRPRGSKEVFRPLDRLALCLLAEAVSRDLGRKIGPKYLRRMLEHMATASLLMRPEQFWSNE